jgi:hypothetical protein
MYFNRRKEKKNQIDHVMTDSRHADDISDVRIFQGADCNMDHFLVRNKVKQRTAVGKKMKGEKITRANTKVLANEEMRPKDKGGKKKNVLKNKTSQ